MKSVLSPRRAEDPAFLGGHSLPPRLVDIDITAVALRAAPLGRDLPNLAVPAKARDQLHWKLERTVLATLANDLKDSPAERELLKRRLAGHGRKIRKIENTSTG